MGGGPDAYQRIYQLSREVLEFRRAVQPLSRLLDLLASGYAHEMYAEVRRYLGDVYDHAVRTAGQVETFRELLSNILNVTISTGSP